MFILVRGVHLYFSNLKDSVRNSDLASQTYSLEKLQHIPAIFHYIQETQPVLDRAWSILEERNMFSHIFHIIHIQQSFKR